MIKLAVENTRTLDSHEVSLTEILDIKYSTEPVGQLEDLRNQIEHQQEIVVKLVEALVYKNILDNKFVSELINEYYYPYRLLEVIKIEK